MVEFKMCLILSNEYDFVINDNDNQNIALFSAEVWLVIYKIIELGVTRTL